jgi:hypothetical protein
MTLNLQCHDVLNDNTPKTDCTSQGWFEYQTFTTPSSYEPAPISRDLGETILTALNRDDRLRLAYLRRRWQGPGD